MEYVLSALLFFVLVKLSIVLHELGHGLVYLVYTEGDLYLYVGDVPSDNFQFRIGRIHFAFNHWLLRNTGGIDPLNHIVTRREGIMLYLAGPLMTLAIILTCTGLYYVFPKTIMSTALLYVAMINMYFLFFSLVPMTWYGGPMKGVKNDGTRIKELLAKS